MAEFTHIQDDKAQMVDISAKDEVIREAVAAGKIFLRPETLACNPGGDCRERQCPFHCPGCSNTFGQEYSFPYPDVPFHPHQCDQLLIFPKVTGSLNQRFV